MDFVGAICTGMDSGNGCDLKRSYYSHEQLLESLENLNIFLHNREVRGQASLVDP